MKASEFTVSRFLHGNDQYIIPVFQRYYSWERKNWQQLMDDITALLDEDASERRHFMGSIVTVPEEREPGKVSPFQVIDGQQRLTTLMLLFCAIRDVARNKGWDELGAEVEQNYLVHQFKKKREHYKVYPRLRDRAGYLALVDGRDAGDEGLIVAGYRYFRELLERGLAVDEPALRQLFNALADRVDFVVITLGKESPYKIFRSLNSTGVDLSEADLIRNHVFMCLPIDEQDTFDDDLWRPLEQRFIVDGKVSGWHFEEFLRNELMRTGRYIGRHAIFETFETQYRINHFDPRKLLPELQAAATTYDIVRGTARLGDSALEGPLEMIRALQATTAYPLATTLLHEALHGRLARDEAAKALRGIAGFVLRRMICGKSSRAYGRWFVAACRDFSTGGLGAVINLLNSKGWPSDEQFNAAFVRFPLYNSKYTYVVLSAIERSIQAKSEPVLLSGCSVEHVMPQTINPSDGDGRAWTAALGPDWKTAHGEWLHTPGNLTLVGADYNTQMSNSTYAIKRPMLSASKVYLNGHFGKVADWGIEQIAARGQQLADRAIKLWPGPSVP